MIDLKFFHKEKQALKQPIVKPLRMADTQVVYHSLCSLLCLFLFCSFCHSDFVRTADDLINLFQSATGEILKTNIELLDDLDFSDTPLSLPLGAGSNGKCTAYSHSQFKMNISHLKMKKVEFLVTPL